MQREDDDSRYVGILLRRVVDSLWVLYMWACSFSRLGSWYRHSLVCQCRGYGIEYHERQQGGVLYVAGLNSVYWSFCAW